MRARRRHPSIASDPDRVMILSLAHPAIVERRTLFPSMVVNAEDAPRLLVSGQNSRKLGSHVTKGKWRGFPIYQLTLEERATCPRSCFHWLTCYGNSLHRSRRHRHGPALVSGLEHELRALQREHPRGFVVRLHVLGDFYSPDYVDAWCSWLAMFPALHVFGYTAWQDDTPIGRAVARLRDRQWDRFAVRTTDSLTTPNSVTIWRQPEAPAVTEGIVCPAETGGTECCGTCGLCWAAKDKTVVFIAHGRPGRPTGRRSHIDHSQVIADWNAGATIQEIADRRDWSNSTIANIVGAAQKTGAAHRGRPGTRDRIAQQVPA